MTSESSSSTLVPVRPRDTAAATVNDVNRFVYKWFTYFEHRAPAARLAAHLDGSTPFSLRFPGAELLNVRQFTEWYKDLLTNTTWNFHKLTRLTVEPADEDTFTVALEMDWYGGVTEDSAWSANQPDGRTYHYVIRQLWEVKVHAGHALDDGSFFIADLGAEML